MISFSSLYGFRESRNAVDTLITSVGTAMASQVLKPLQDWHFKDVLHFFKSSVTNGNLFCESAVSREL